MIPFGTAPAFTLASGILPFISQPSFRKPRGNVPGAFADVPAGQGRQGRQMASGMWIGIGIGNLLVVAGFRRRSLMKEHMLVSASEMFPATEAASGSGSADQRDGRGCGIYLPGGQGGQGGWLFMNDGVKGRGDMGDGSRRRFRLDTGCALGTSETSVQHGDLAEFPFLYRKTKAFLACTVYK